MEADDFFNGYEALQSASCSLQLTLNDPCPVSKIVWSSFDHITGPELRFVWEVVAATNLSPVALSTNSESTKDGSVSTTSSISRDTNGSAYEEIDDLLQISKDVGQPQYLDEFMMESRSTLAATTTVTDEDEDISRLVTSFASSSQFTEDDSQSEETFHPEGAGDDENPSAVKNSENFQKVSSSSALHEKSENGASSFYKIAKAEAVGYGLDPLTTVNELKDEANERSLKTNKFADENDATVPSDSKTVMSSLAAETEIVPCAPGSDCDHHFWSPDHYHSAQLCGDISEYDYVPAALTTSGVDSGIAGTVSAHSDLSAYCASPLLDTDSIGGSTTYCKKMHEGHDECKKSNCSCSYVINESIDYDTLMEISGESNCIPPTDDEFIAKLVLTDQVYSLQFPSVGLIHKVNIVPKRKILIGSYLFPVKRADDDKSITCAISVVTTDSNYEWYMQRQPVIEEMFMDVIARLKASYYSEAIEDIICRMRTEFERMLSVLGIAERHSIPTSVDDIKIHQTYLCDQRLQENTFLAKAITGLLRSQSHCVVVGDQRRMVQKVLNTLSLFVPEQWRWCSLRDHKFTFSPYLRLQSISRSELSLVITAGVESHWPISVIDVDKQLVCISSNYLKHRKLKQLRQRNDVAGILLSAGIDEVENSDVRQYKLELRNCHSCDAVVDFLGKMDFLPYERNARIGFIRQFMLTLENRARAFITYVQDASKPNPTDKMNAISSRWNLNATRRALDLTSESLFSIILAEAERLQTGIADFICDTRSL